MPKRIEDIIRERGFYITKTKGTSMYPLIKGDCSDVCIVRIDGDIKKYDVIYVGFPIWWYIAPTIINTFLEQYDLSGKVIVPFFTSGGSEAGETVKHLQPSAPNAKILPAENLTGDDEANIKKWVDSLKF